MAAAPTGAAAIFARPHHAASYLTPACSPGPAPPGARVVCRAANPGQQVVSGARPDRRGVTGSL